MTDRTCLWSAQPRVTCVPPSMQCLPHLLRQHLLVADGSRHPAADVLTAGLTEPDVVDPTGVRVCHDGHGTAPHTVRVLQNHGYDDGTRRRAREFRREWFSGMDPIVATNKGHVPDLRGRAPDDPLRLRPGHYASSTRLQPNRAHSRSTPPPSETPPAECSLPLERPSSSRPTALSARSRC